MGLPNRMDSMTTLDHALTGALMVASLTDNPHAISLGALSGAWMDIDGRVSGDDTYNWWHHTWRWWYLIIPPLALHWAVDWVMHEPDGKWWPREWAFCTFYWMMELLWLGPRFDALYVRIMTGYGPLHLHDIARIVGVYFGTSG